MILMYYQGYVSLDKLSEMMNTTQNGTTAYNLKETLKELGFNSYGFKSENIDALKLPCIAHVIIKHSYKHYVVIYKVNLKRKTMLIADPSTGLKKLSFNEFQQIWSGVTIHMYPATHIVYEPKPKTLKFIWYYIKKHLKLVVVIQILSIFISLLTVSSSMFFPLLISLLDDQEKIYTVFLLFLFIFSIKNILSFIKNRLLTKLNLDLNQELQVDIFNKILNLPYRYYRRKTTGEITSYFNDLYTIRNAISNFTQISLIELPLILLLIISILKINIFIFIITIAIIFLVFITTLTHQKKQNIWISESIRHKAIINSYITENIIGFETIKNLNIIDKVQGIFKEKYQNFLKITQKVFTYEINSEFLKNIINDLGILLIAITIFKISNDLKFFVILFILSSFLISSIKNILDFNYQINEVKSALINIIELITKKSENINILKTCGDIVIKNLNYSYNKKDYVLKDINLTIKSKSKVMVTGNSGSGKSTLFKIIKGYYNDYEGSVKIENNEINKNYFDNIIYVSQKEILFTGTLKDNLNLKSENLKNIKICEIDKFSKGDHNELIEEDGFNLSGGQKQRIVLARALNNFDILIIDEGLNQVSIDMERRILKNLFNNYSNKTIIYISHRLDNLDLFNQYIKMQKGKVVVDTKRNN